MPPECFERSEDHFGRQFLEGVSAEECVAHAIEEVGDGGEIDGDFIREPVGARHPRARGRFCPLRVVPAPSRRIGQNFVGARCLEEGDRTVVSRDVGVIPTGQLPVRALDLFCASARRYA